VGRENLTVSNDRKQKTDDKALFVREDRPILSHQIPVPIEFHRVAHRTEWDSEACDHGV